MARLYSYVIRYDSAFAPNPFYQRCTIATCKPPIRGGAQIGDWVVGTGSHEKPNNRGTRLVCAMKITEACTFEQYWSDPRFFHKRPMRHGSRKQSCGDNIYHRNDANTGWLQLDSFHSNPDGTINHAHVTRDTSVNRVLISEDFYYFGGEGPEIPAIFRDPHVHDVCRKVRTRARIDDDAWVKDFVAWLRTLGEPGYRGRPLDWIKDDG